MINVDGIVRGPDSTPCSHRRSETERLCRMWLKVAQTQVLELLARHAEMSGNAAVTTVDTVLESLRIPASLVLWNEAKQNFDE